MSENKPLRTIKTKGKQTLATPADWVDIQLMIQSTHTDYDYMMNEFEQKIDALIDDILLLGYTKDALKTTHFNIETKYNYRNNERIFEGYQITQQFVWGMPFERAELNQIIRQLATSSARPTIDLSFTLSDQKDVQHQLLQGAIIDAKEKAKVMAETLDVIVGDVLTIEEMTHVPIMPRKMAHTYAFEQASLDIAPEDLRLSQEVEITWNIQ